MEGKANMTSIQNFFFKKEQPQASRTLGNDLEIKPNNLWVEGAEIKIKDMWVVVAQAFSLVTWEVEADGSLSYRPVWSSEARTTQGYTTHPVSKTKENTKQN